MEIGGDVLVKHLAIDCTPHDLGVKRLSIDVYGRFSLDIRFSKINLTSGRARPQKLNLFFGKKVPFVYPITR